ncbi:MAG: peptidase S41, partial [Bacteroidales bacterium]|nr:peptidase S41 [Bacteroidales bacterium]
SMMQVLPDVTVMGDSTGGGGGLPFNSELPCGWTFRFSAAPMLNAAGEQIENGVAPDVFCQMDTVALRQGIDSMIEAAADYLQGLE